MSRDKLSLDNFKRWMKTHQEDDFLMDKPTVTECLVESKVNLKRLLSKITSETHNPEEVANDFIKSGGKIVSTDGKNVLIEVASGTFFVHRCYVKKV